MAGCKKDKKKISGVTLIEILVAMVILGIGLYMVYNTFPLGFIASIRSKNRTIASELAQKKLEEIINNRVPVSCYHDETGSPCRSQPLEGDYTTPDYGASFDCRFLYGGPLSNSKVQNGTFGGYHMGTTDPGNWIRCSTNPQESAYNFWYHIGVTPVVDPCQKYRSTGDLQRIIVSVRGPIDDMNDWQIQTTSRRDSRFRGPIEVIISTLKANKFLACTTIDRNYRIDESHLGVGPDGLETSVFIGVYNVRNFTMFNKHALSQEELMDRPKVTYLGMKNESGEQRYMFVTKQGGNFYGLDNVKITRSDTNTGKVDLIRTDMTNKILRIVPDISINPETNRHIPGKIRLLYPLYEDSFARGHSDDSRNYTVFFDEDIPGGHSTYAEVFRDNVDCSLVTGGGSAILKAGTYYVQQQIGVRQPLNY